MLTPRPYQELAVARCLWQLRVGEPTLLVAPTGAGKTCMGTMNVAELGVRTVWVVHTRDLVAQTAAKLTEYGVRVGCIAPGFDADPFAPVQVVSIQTLIARELEIRAELLVLDEAHHYLATEWRAAYETIRASKILGLTATPERADGQPLGDTYRRLVVAAQYSELTSAGYLAPLRILRPRRELSRGIALKPGVAYTKHGEGRQAFLYARSVPEAKALASEIQDAACIDFETPKEERALSLSRFLSGELRVLTNQRVLTEGVDIPAASCCIWAKNFSHLSGALQSAGRVLRPHPSKETALLLDLPGLTHREGWIPTEDKEYSLDGRGIRKSPSAIALTVCMSCGMTYPSGGPCPRCGHEPIVRAAKPLKVYNEELQPFFAGRSTPDWAKKAELDRLLMVARDKKLNHYWVSQEYERLFGEKPELGRAVGDDERKAKYTALKEQGALKGYSRGWASHRYKHTYGAFPPRSWG